MSDTIHQKVSYELYKQELDKIYIRSKEMKSKLLKKARTYTILSVLINYPTKLLMGIAVGGGGIQLFTTPSGSDQSATAMFVGQHDNYWIQVTRMIFEIAALILVITRDFFLFETQVEKLYTAAQAIESFCTSIKYESFLQKGSEGDRFQTLLTYKKMYEDLISDNKVIQTVELTSPSTPPDEHHKRPSADMESATNSDEPDEENQLDEKRTSLTEHKKRLFLIHTQLERMPK